MSGGSCYRPGFERGPWFELKCLREIITGLESRGKSAAWERKLYAAWLKHQEYALADKNNRQKGLYVDLPPMASGEVPVSIISGDINIPPKNIETPPKPVLDIANTTLCRQERKKRGRPRKSGKVSRSTAWRRKQEKQGVLR